MVSLWKATVSFVPTRVKVLCMPLRGEIKIEGNEVRGASFASSSFCHCYLVFFMDLFKKARLAKWVHNLAPNALIGLIQSIITAAANHRHINSLGRFISRNGEKISFHREERATCRDFFFCRAKGGMHVHMQRRVHLSVWHRLGQRQNISWRTQASVRKNRKGKWEKRRIKKEENTLLERLEVWSEHITIEKYLASRWGCLGIKRGW